MHIRDIEYRIYSRAKATCYQIQMTSNIEFGISFAANRNLSKKQGSIWHLITYPFISGQQHLM